MLKIFLFYNLFFMFIQKPIHTYLLNNNLILCTIIENFVIKFKTFGILYIIILKSLSIHLNIILCVMVFVFFKI